MSGGRGTSSQIASWTFWYASITSGSRAYCPFMSAGERFAFFASSTSQGAEKPPLLIPAWQFWQRSTVGPPQELRRFSIQYCSICGSLPIPLYASSRLSISRMGFSAASIFACAASRRLTKASRRSVAALWAAIASL